MIEVYHTPEYVCPIDGGKRQRIMAQNSGGEQYVDLSYKPYGFIDELGYVAGYDKIVDAYGGEIEETEYHPIDPVTKKPKKDKAYAVKFPNPSNVRKAHDWLKSNNMHGYEMDIRYIRRLFIDEIVKIRYPWDRVVFLDVECDDSMGFMDYGEMKIKSVAWSREGSLKSVQGDEITIFSEITDSILKEGWSVIVGWNVEFDKGHIIKRMTKCLKAFKGEEKITVTDAVRQMLNCDWIDLRRLYMEAVKGLSRYSLDEVAAHEGIGEKKRSKKICEMTREELKTYNENDVDLTVKLEEKYGLVKIKLKMCELVNLPYKCASSSLIWDTLVIRRLRELGYVAPTRNVGGEHKTYQGAYVKPPKPGIHENIAYIDFVSLYPNIVIRDKIDVYDFKGEVVPYLMEKFMKLKDECEKIGDKLGRSAYKNIMNAGYGQFGFKGSRFYDPEKAEKITRGGRRAVMELIDLLDGIGLEVIYGDTDSCFFNYSGIEDVMGVVKYVNEKMEPLKVKLEAKFRRILFFGGYDGDVDEGVAKKYIGITFDGKVIQRGLETRRRDWCKYTKEVVGNVAMMILDGRKTEEILDYLDAAKKKLFSGEIPDEYLAITKNVRVGGYKKEPKHYKLWKIAVEKNL
ncbi:MAG: DNA polymerase domain-containing protein, partial [Desulfurococcaceae archaeon]